MINSSGQPGSAGQPMAGPALPGGTRQADSRPGTLGSYLSGIVRGVASTWRGLALTLTHIRRARAHRRRIHDVRDPGYFAQTPEGIVTVSWPDQPTALPEGARQLLHNQVEDCIVCDKCVRVCPVDCIDIVPIRSATEISKTSDGSSKRIYAARFDIDMAKCCYCGLCTTVCPTECLTMTPTFDYSTHSLGKLTFGFGELDEAEAEARTAEWQQAQAAREAAKKPAAPQAPKEAITPTEGTAAPAEGYAPTPAPAPPKVVTGAVPRPGGIKIPVVKKPTPPPAPPADGAA